MSQFELTNSIIGNPNIPGSVKPTLIGISYFANDEGFAWPNRETVAELMGISVKTVSRSLKWVRENEFPMKISKKVVAYGLSSNYTFDDAHEIGIWVPRNLSGGRVGSLSPEGRDTETRGVGSESPSNRPYLTNQITDFGCQSDNVTEIASATPLRATPTLRDESVFPDSICNQEGMSDDEFFDLKYRIAYEPKDSELVKRWNAELNRRRDL